MKLSAPIYLLKNQAKKMSRSNELTLTQALDHVAKKEGYCSWSLLMAKSGELIPSRYDQLLNYFNSGDLVLIGAGPFEEKTTFVIGLFVQALIRANDKSFFFSLSEVQGDVEKRITKTNSKVLNKTEKYQINCSDEICAQYIVDYCGDKVTKGSLVVIDYLQLLDQVREKDSLQRQVEELKHFAKEKEIIIIFIAQLNRFAKEQIEKRPILSDINLPNPLDLDLINKIFFIQKHQKNAAQFEVILARQNSSFLIGWNRKYRLFHDLTAGNLINDPYENKVLSSFLVDGKIMSIPVKRKKRVIILKYILKSFESNKKYSEVEVNRIIQRFHEDYCLIRREFICEKMMARERGYYWILDKN